MDSPSSITLFSCPLFIDKANAKNMRKKTSCTRAGCSAPSSAESVTACLEAQERKSNKDNKICNGTCPPGLKSHFACLLMQKEKGKCDAVKHCAQSPVSEITALNSK